MSAFAGDTSEAAKRVRELLDEPTPDAARRLLDDLPSLVPGDPAIAAVIAEEMATSFSEAFRAEQAGTGGLTQEEAERIYEEMMAG